MGCYEIECPTHIEWPQIFVHYEFTPRYLQITFTKIGNCMVNFPVTVETKEEAVEPTKIPEKLTLDLRPRTNQAWVQVRIFFIPFIKGFSTIP